MLFNPLVPKLFHDLPSKYVSLFGDDGHEWVNFDITVLCVYMRYLYELWCNNIYLFQSLLFVPQVAA